MVAVKVVDNPGSSFKRFWNFLWNDESITGWLVSLIIIFVVIKFLLFPALSLVLGTGLPLVVVESSSMSHDAFIFGEFDSWWLDSSNSEWYLDRSINMSEASRWSLKSGFEKGDIIMLVGVSPQNLEVGDVIVFDAGQTNPIIHRIIGITVGRDGSLVFSTKGDNNIDMIPQDRNISEDKVIGKALIKVPKLGWVKLLLVDFFGAFR